MSTYTVKNIKTFIGNEGHGFNAVLYRDGKKVAFVCDDACGGETQFEWVDFKNVRVECVVFNGYNDETPTIKCTTEEANLWNFCKTQPIQTTEYGDFKVTPESFVGRLVDEELTSRKIKRKLKTGIFFVLKGEETEGVRSFKGKHTPLAIREHIKKTYGDKATIVNDMPLAKAIPFFYGE